MQNSTLLHTIMISSLPACGQLPSARGERDSQQTQHSHPDMQANTEKQESEQVSKKDEITRTAETLEYMEKYSTAQWKNDDAIRKKAPHNQNMYFPTCAAPAAAMWLPEHSKMTSAPQLSVSSSTASRRFFAFTSMPTILPGEVKLSPTYWEGKEKVSPI